MSTAPSPLPFEGARLIVVMGVSSSGKSTVGQALARRLHAPFLEGDKYHPEANIEKMSAGIPLTDADRWPWLDDVGRWLAEHGGVTACSALRRAYRDVLRTAPPTVEFVHLAGPPEVVRSRLAVREGHYMPASLLDSQLRTLEPLEPDETGVVLDLTRTPAELVCDATAWLGC